MRAALFQLLRKNSASHAVRALSVSESQTYNVLDRYDYALNTRANHLPHPSLVYSQFLDDMWKSIPQAQELIAQIAFTVAAGSKGLMLFQDGIAEFKQDPSTFEQAGGALKSIQAAGPTIMSGDIGGVRFQYDNQDGKVLVSVVRSPKAYLVVAVNLNADGYNGQLCNVDIAQHWKFHDQSVGDVVINIAPDASVSSVTELVNGTKVDASAASDVSGRTVTIRDVQLAAAMPARFFLLEA